jgi:hypothetical protein
MQRGQATVEYAALVLLALVVACSLVRFHTPVQALAADLARAATAHPRRHRVVKHPAGRHGGRHRAPDRRCLCPFEAQAKRKTDD